MTAEEIFWLAHEGLPRHAPGSAATTRLLLSLVGPLPTRPRVLDVGCGRGTASLLLAAETDGTVLSVDTHPPFLAQLRAAAATVGLGDRVVPIRASMTELPLPDGSIDLIWAEGSAYVMGFDQALSSWRRLLTAHGAVVLTEAEWTTLHPAPDAARFWAAGYPAMRSTDGNVRAALAAGWRVQVSYLLPDADWAAYYDPLAQRLEQLRHDGHDPAVLDGIGEEILLRRRHGADYGYTGYVLRPAETAPPKNVGAAH